MNIVLVGPIASGKGTLAQNLKEKLGLTHISVGDLFREILNSNSPLKNQIKSFMDSGQLVPDEITVNVLLERIKKDDCKNGIILDGFPRNLAQAKAMEGKIDIDKVILINASEDVIVQRITSRISCPKCNKVYNKSWYFKDNCECGEKLIQRADDLNQDAIKSRLKVFETQTKDVIKYYKNCSKLVELDGNKGAQSVLENALKVL